MCSECEKIVAGKLKPKCINHDELQKIIVAWSRNSGHTRSCKACLDVLSNILANREKFGILKDVIRNNSDKKSSYFSGIRDSRGMLYESRRKIKCPNCGGKLLDACNSKDLLCKKCGKYFIEETRYIEIEVNKSDLYDRQNKTT